MFPSTRSSREGKPSAAGSFAASTDSTVGAKGRPTITRFIALGDSFTEGLNDRLRVDGRHLGWADRVAEELVFRQGIEQLTYANLAVRGRLTAQVVFEQVPAAIEFERGDPNPSGSTLVSVGAGVNDALRRGFDLGAVATDLENGVRALRGQGMDVLLFAFGDPSRRSAVLGRIAQRMADLRSATVEIARVYGCSLVDFWGLARYDDERLWSGDRLHLSPQGHSVTSQAVLAALGLGDSMWRGPRSDPLRPPWRVRRLADAGWLGGHLAPWMLRRARGISSGLGVEPKDPSLRVVHNPRARNPQVRSHR